MPKIVSQAQRAAMHAAAKGQSTLGISKAVGQSAEDPGGPLPARAPAERQSNLKGPPQPRSFGTPSTTPKGLSSLVRRSKKGA